MVVSEIIELPKGRRKIITDEGEAFYLYKGELAKLNIITGEKIREEDYERIMMEILPKRAKLRGLNLLTRRPYTEHQLRQKYIDGGYPEQVIDTAIQYIKDVHCLDDYNYCVTYISYKSSSKSRRQIVNDLKNKGVSQSIIDEAYRKVEDNGDLTGEAEVIGRLLIKKHYNPQTATFEEKQKMMNFLYNKGFSMDSIREMVG
ncbi:MAG: regulatory protein RecX [Lachnospiraceae bacterium]|nr:regulatory protein RecX [Candidatus Colinaster scatohippi]